MIASVRILLALFLLGLFRCHGLQRDEFDAKPLLRHRSLILDVNVFGWLEGIICFLFPWVSFLSCDDTPTPLATNWIEVDPNAPIDKRHEACFVMVGTKAYLVGGRGNRDLDIFDPVTRTWSKGTSPRLELHHMQCVAAQGKLWIVAAWTGNFPTEDNAENGYMYDPSTDSWELLTALPPSRRRGSAAVVVSEDESKLYVSHGNSGGHETNNHATSLGYLDMYDIASDTWTAMSSDAPNPRDHTGGSLIGNRICVAGGRDGGEVDWPHVAPTDCYDLETGIWSEEAAIPQMRSGSSYGTTCNGHLMIAGGEGFGKAWDLVDVFDGQNWTTFDRLNVGRHGSGLAMDCSCGLIYIASGAKTEGGADEIRSVEIYFPDGVDAGCPASQE